MLREPVAEVEARARRLASTIAREIPGLEAGAVPSVARSGGGTLPGYEIPSFAVRVSGMDAGELAARLRAAEPPVVGRVHEGALLLDARTLLPGDEEAVLEALREAAGG